MSGGRSWRYSDTLAAAYAVSGEFDAAKKWQAKAIASAMSDPSISEKCKKALHYRMELYEHSQPFRGSGNREGTSPENGE